MFPGGRLFRALCAVAFVSFCTCAFQAQTGLPSPAPPLVVEGLGRGTVALDGPWQFHQGDDMAWANPDTDDSAGQNGWEQLTADKPWGEQGHPNNGGFGWYRRHILFTSIPGESARGGTHGFAVFFPAVQDAYQVYWNGALVGSFGKLPPHPDVYSFSEYGASASPFDLGLARNGVLAVRVWKSPPVTDGTPFQGGLVTPPVLGDADAVARYRTSLEYDWLRSSQFVFALNSLYALAALLAFLYWLRDRKQALLFWMTGYCIGYPTYFLTFFAHLPFTRAEQLMVFGIFTAIRDVSLWLLLLLLLHLDEQPTVVRWVRGLAWLQLVSAGIDGPVCVIAMSGAPGWFVPAQKVDDFLTIIYTLLEVLPLVLITFAIARRQRLDPVRWLVAALAFLTEMIEVVYTAAQQGRAYTHSTLRETIETPLFTVFGSAINIQTLANTLLLLAIIYAVYRYTAEERRKQATLEQEIRNARAVQQVLIPDEIPEIPGFNIQSVYKPFGEVGGDFFQILPLKNGGLLAVIGDVSGKGMPAAMTVSLLVGTVRTLAHFVESPGEILAAMNQRMLGRSQGGFTTCLVLRVDSDGALTVANAGHIAPYIDGREFTLENGLPLGLAANTIYSESTFELAENRQLTLITDGVVEARDASGSLFGFERTATLSVEPAETVATAAQQFGQDDDITVLTVTRLMVDQAVSSQQTAPVLPPA